MFYRLISMEDLPKNPYQHLLTALPLNHQQYSYYDINKLADPRIKELPIAIKILLESAVRNCDGFNVTKEDVENIINWKHTSTTCVTPIPSRPKCHSSPPESSSRISQECPLWSTSQP